MEGLDSFFRLEEAGHIEEDRQEVREAGRLDPQPEEGGGLSASTLLDFFNQLQALRIFYFEKTRSRNRKLCQLI